MMIHPDARPKARFSLLRTASWVWFAALASCGSWSSAELRSQDELWLVSTRSIGCVDAEQLAPDDFRVSRWNESECQWIDSSWRELNRTDSRTKWTTIYVHGNRIEPGEDMYHGREWYRSLVHSDDSLPPLRFIIWSWPSSQIRGQLKDIRAKYRRSQYESDYLGWYLLRTPRRPTLLIGFSYGGLIVPGALQYAADHRDGEDRTPPWSAMLVAAAEPTTWLWPDGRHGRAFEEVRRAIVLVNPCDPALKRFGAVDPCNRPSAVGYAGFPVSGLPARAQADVSFYNVSGIVGRIHDEHPYRNSITVGGWITEAARAALDAR